MNYLVIFLFVIGFLAILNVYNGYSETFSTLTYGNYPESQDNYLLYDTYEQNKEKTNLDTNSYEASLMNNESRVQMSSYKQETNNKKNWSNPDNGNCIPTDFCGTFYKSKSKSKDSNNGGCSLEDAYKTAFSSETKRVNLYSSLQ